MGVGGQRHAPAALSPGKTRYPLYNTLHGPQGGLDRYGESHPRRDSIPGPSGPNESLCRLYYVLYITLCIVYKTIILFTMFHIKLCNIYIYNSNYIYFIYLNFTSQFFAPLSPTHI